MKFKYRKGTIADKDKLQVLGILSYSQHQQEMTPEYWNKFIAYISDPETFTSLINTSTCFICQYENEIIGMAFLVSNGHPTDMFEDNWSYIRMVGVNPSYGGNGIAKKLTEMCINFANETNESYIALHTSEFMDAARNIYEGFGFKIVRELTRYNKKYWIYLLALNTNSND